MALYVHVGCMYFVKLSAFSLQAQKGRGVYLTDCEYTREWGCGVDTAGVACYYHLNLMCTILYAPYRSVCRVEIRVRSVRLTVKDIRTSQA